MSDQDYTPLKAALEMLSNDLNAAGWDLPNRFFSIDGTTDDPILHLLLEDHNHPVDVLNAAFKAGLSIPDSAVGLCISTEGYTPRSFDELEPAMRDAMRTIADSHDFTQDELEEVCRTAWMGIITRVSPSALPPNCRIEIRTTIAVLRNGDVIYCAHKRETGETICAVDVGGTQAGGAVRDTMMRFLRGQDPNPDATGGIFLLGPA